MYFIVTLSKKFTTSRILAWLVGYENLVSKNNSLYLSEEDLQESEKKMERLNPRLKEAAAYTKKEKKQQKKKIYFMLFDIISMIARVFSIRNTEFLFHVMVFRVSLASANWQYIRYKFS